MTMTLKLGFLSLLNQSRKKQGLSELALNETLCIAAQQHAKFMQETKTLTHTGAAQSDFSDRLNAADYDYLFAGENLAFEVTTPDEAFAIWMDSPPHKDTMLNKVYTEIGIGRVGRHPDNSPANNPYWCIILATPNLVEITGSVSASA